MASTRPNRECKDDAFLQAACSSREDTFEAVSGVLEKPRSNLQHQMEKGAPAVRSPERISDERRELGAQVLKITLTEHTGVTTLLVHPL